MRNGLGSSLPRGHVCTACESHTCAERCAARALQRQLEAAQPPGRRRPSSRAPAPRPLLPPPHRPGTPGHPTHDPASKARRHGTVVARLDDCQTGLTTTFELLFADDDSGEREIECLLNDNHQKGKMIFMIMKTSGSQIMKTSGSPHPSIPSPTPTPTHTHTRHLHRYIYIYKYINIYIYTYVYIYLYIIYI